MNGDGAVSPLWCADDAPHVEHWDSIGSGRGNYCSGRTSPKQEPAEEREALFKLLYLWGDERTDFVGANWLTTRDAYALTDKILAAHTPSST